MTYEELLENYSEARKGDTKMKRNLISLYRGFMVEIDARVNDKTMDRCGKEISVGIEKSKIENGKTIETWEGLPDGWITTNDKKDLCPDCARQYSELQKRFFQK